MTDGRKGEDRLEVYLDAPFVGGPTQLGTLSHKDGQVRFVYATAWLKHERVFQIDPSLSLDGATFFPDAGHSNFGIFLDSSPDRWGQRLMDRRERLAAVDEKRKPRKLHAWDYLIGVQDVTRMGALRFRREEGQPFLDDHPFPAPPVTELRTLEAIAGDISSAKHEPTGDQLRKWLSILVAPGASLGGAKPKANYLEADGSLWIAKFPSRDDDRDHGLWELLCREMASEALIDCPPATVRRFNHKFHTYCIRRFDRSGDDRAFFTSAMSALGKVDGEEGSYLDLVQFLERTAVDKASLKADLGQLYRRVVFNAMVGNCDDHLRNHGFLFDERGWRLAPAYDVNPSTSDEHVLDFDGASKTPDIDLLHETSAYYQLRSDEAAAIVEQIAGIVRTWDQRARKLGINRDDIEATRSAFALAEAVSEPKEVDVPMSSPR